VVFEYQQTRKQDNPKEFLKDFKGFLHTDGRRVAEEEFAELSPDERFGRRLKKSKPVAEAFFEWLDGLGALPKSALGEANTYALNQRGWLMNAYLDGGTELSNNRTERAIRPLVQGRKIWLFSTSVDGAAATSVMYSLIETAKANGLHPQRYLEHLLTVLPNAKTSDLESLLPWSGTLPKRCRAPKNAAPVE
jgi:hypothetical protein